MNKYELLASRERKSALRKTVLIWAFGAVLVLATVVFLNSRDSLPTRSKVVVLLAVVLLAGRQIARRLKTSRSRAAEPDPQSRLNLD